MAGGKKGDGHAMGHTRYTLPCVVRRAMAHAKAPPIFGTIGARKL